MHQLFPSQLCSAEYWPRSLQGGNWETGIFQKCGRKPAQSSNAAVCGYGVLHQQGQRDSQQDAFCVTGQEPSGILAAVADGMGGLVTAERFSQALTETLAEEFTPDPRFPPARQLQIAFQQAVGKVDALLRDHSSRSGSTLVACLVQNGALSWLSVGDSRIYLCGTAD